MKKYPFIKMTFWRGDTEEIIAKLSAEIRAKNLIADVVEGTGVGELAVEARLTLPISRRSRPCRNATAIRTAIGRARASATSASLTTPGWCRPIRYRRPTTTARPRWRGKLAWRIGSSAARRCSHHHSARPRRSEGAEYFQKLPRRRSSTSDRQRAHPGRSCHRG